MLLEISSDILREKCIRFHSGMNVVLGDENATNSIGKSTLLMIVDFALGGKTLLTFNTDLISELGQHTYLFTFAFDEQEYRFQRRTQEENVVYRCDNDGLPVQSITLEKYCSFLRQSYQIEIQDLTFRSFVGLYFRVWGKENLNTDRPLHIVPQMTTRECVDNLLKSFDKYEPISTTVCAMSEVDANLKALKNAVKYKIVPQAGKRAYASNAKRILQLESELDDIKANLANYATNLSAIVNKEVLSLKLDKDNLLELRLTTSSKLQRTQNNLAGNRHIKSQNFAEVIKFFPEVDQARLARVEEFHDGLAVILKEELRASERKLSSELARIDEELGIINEELAKALSSIKQPTSLIDHIFKIAVGLKLARDENSRFDEEGGLEEQRASLKNTLKNEKKRIVAEIEGSINAELRRLVDLVFGATRRSPKLKLSESSYSYAIPEDTGTGSAYIGLILFDLTVFLNTKLPALAHDSILFKNIENDSVARILDAYKSTSKQSFIALDEISKYGSDAAAVLRSHSVVQLDSTNVLFTKDWRR